MPNYTAPIKDIQYVLHDVLQISTKDIDGYDELDRETTGAIFEEAGKLAEQVLAPLNQIGDQQGCTFENGVITTPDGFKTAFDTVKDGGWAGLDCDPDYGGQGMPYLVGSVVNELFSSANMAFSMYQGLTHGAYSAIHAHGTEQQKQTFLPKMVSCDWTGTMNLTEPHCGTDLGLLRTKAEPQADGSYKVTGQKIFISAGDHDLSENVIHLVLAKIPGGPEGVKGISLFIVPKFDVNADGTLGGRNGVSVGKIEEKMGIHGNATCVMNFDEATGFLLGTEHKGMRAMFTMMNEARNGVAVQGLSQAVPAYQEALQYAKDRLQGRDVTGTKNPDGPADPLIVHPDIRRMLMDQKSFIEGARAMVCWAATLIDQARRQDDAEAEALVSLLTPVLKGFLTEQGFQMTVQAQQVFGGHGYIAEWGAEQNVRDSRISTLYEGTTGIQALDLLGRKVLQSQGEMLKRFTKIIHKFCQAHKDNAALQAYIEPLATVNKEWGELTMHIGLAAMNNADEVGAASVDYLMYSGYITQAYFWARAAAVAQAKLGGGESDFYQAKLKTATFYYQRILPRTRTLHETIKSGAANLTALDAEHFSF